MTTAQEAAREAVTQLGNAHDLAVGCDWIAGMVSLWEGDRKVADAFIWPQGASAVRDQLLAAWLLAHGLPAITLAVFYDGSPYPPPDRYFLREFGARASHFQELVTQ